MNSQFNDKIGLILIEDLPLTRKAIELELQHEQDIICLGMANDGGSGLAMVETQKPHVAIVDYHLGELDGIELIHKIKQASPKTKVITLTQEEDPFLLLQIKEAGSDAIILKKFEHTLKEIIHHVANHGTFLQGEIAYLAINAAEKRHMLDQLNIKERAYFEKIGQGKDHATIAKELCVQPATVKKILTNTKRKLEKKTKAELIDLYHAFYPA